MLVTTANDERIVKCDGCGEVIEDGGWMVEHPHEKLYDEHYCDGCWEQKQRRVTEFRICDVCGKVMTDGMTNEGAGLGADFHCHEECFEQAMDERFGQWREIPNHRVGENDGYYEAYDARGQEWYDTGIYWTEWD